MVAGAFQKLVIEEVCLLTPEVWQDLGLLLGVMADEGTQSFHHQSLDVPERRGHLRGEWINTSSLVKVSTRSLQKLQENP